MKKWLSVLLTIPLVFAASCSPDEESSVDLGDGSEVLKNYDGPGIHEASVVKTDKTFIAAGESEYTIVVPDEYYDYEYMGANLISDYLYAATGCRLEIAKESEIADGETKIISVGDTERLRDSGISVAESYLTSNGFRIVTQGDTTFISGARTPLRLGTLYGAQEFLKHTIGWHAYAVDEVWYNEAVYLPYYQMDVVEVPDFEERKIGWYELRSNETYLHYLRLNISNEHALPFSAHSHFEVLPLATYANAHPDWYYCPDTYYPFDGSTWSKETDGTFSIYGQLCISNEEMKEEFIKQLTNWFIEYPDADYCNLGIQDNSYHCICDNCVAKMADYNTNYAGISVIFTNEVAERVQANIHALSPMRDITFQMMVYNAIIPPPVHKENEKWVADNPAVVPAENVAIMYTPLGYNGSETLDHQFNSQYYDYLEGWAVLTDNLTSYVYGMNFTWYLYSHKNWDIMQANWRILAEHGVKSAYNQGALVDVAAQWSPMKFYVESQLMWDLSLNFDDLAYEFIEHYYGICAEEIRDMYDLMTTYVEYIHAKLGYTGNVYFSLNKKEYWSFSYVEAGRMIMEKALAKLEAIKESDPEYYEKYYDRVIRVYLENMYMQMEFHRSEYTATYGNAITDLFERTINKFNMVYMGDWRSSETSRYDYHIAQWREFYNG